MGGSHRRLKRAQRAKEETEVFSTEGRKSRRTRVRPKGEPNKSEDSNPTTLTLLMFAKKSLKNLSVDSETVNWFDYGAYYKDYQNNCFGIKIHFSARFFEPTTGQVWIPKNMDGLMIKVCLDGELKDKTLAYGEVGGVTGLTPRPTQGQVIQTLKFRCDYLTNPLCENLSFEINVDALKKSRQPPWEFEDVLESRGEGKVVIDSIEKAKEVYERYFKDR